MPEEWIDQIFLRMQVAYGHLWTSRYPTEPVLNLARMEWRRKLSVFAASQLRLALEATGNRYPKPPTLPEFVQLCRTFRREGAHKLYRRLPKPRGDKTLGLAELAKMRKAVSAHGREES